MVIYGCCDGLILRPHCGLVYAVANYQRVGVRCFTDGCMLIHSDQCSQYTCEDWMLFLKAHNLESSLSRRGNCHDNAVAESFFQLLKRERVKPKIDNDRDEAKREIFDYIESFYNSKRRHNSYNFLSPIDFEKKPNQSADQCLQSEWRINPYSIFGLPKSSLKSLTKIYFKNCNTST